MIQKELLDKLDKVVERLDRPAEVREVGEGVDLIINTSLGACAISAINDLIGKRVMVVSIEDEMHLKLIIR